MERGKGWREPGFAREVVRAASHRACRCTCPSGSRRHRQAWWWGPWPEAARKGGTSAELRAKVSLLDGFPLPTRPARSKTRQHDQDIPLPSPFTASPSGPGSAPPDNPPQIPPAALRKRLLRRSKFFSCTRCLLRQLPPRKHRLLLLCPWGLRTALRHPTSPRFRAQPEEPCQI